MGGVVKGIGKLFGYDSGAIKDSANNQANASRENASAISQANRDAMQQNQRTQETMLAQQKASSAAASLLDVPVAQAEVEVGGDNAAELNSTTGKRIKPRDAYASGGAGINI